VSDDIEPVEGTVEPEQPRTQVVPFAPAAGEVIDLSDRKRVAATIAELEEWRDVVLSDVLALLRAAMIEEADVQASYTLRYGKITVKVDGPDVARTEWQDDLRPMLVELMDAGMPRERAEQMAAKQLSWKPNHTEVNRAAKNPTYKAIIDRYRTRMPRTRSVKVTGG
jgi:hypothetical protein